MKEVQVQPVRETLLRRSHSFALSVFAKWAIIARHWEFTQGA
ncbi:hypothetical protein DSM3645_18231 [Blastopirellula marina DSM 3645]|uniref:Uncharacterized protein n=1 Tax=Blastopirellula marina DSM 3645 TaxID=314230 RepID=A3ZYU0_9BACT|nr:hypothetical protein DSM3645_18231 [Blastopirellula marina DSM 3645]